MAKVLVKQDFGTSRTELFFALDSSSTTGAGKTANAANMNAWYVRNTSGTAVQITSPGFVEIDATNLPGVYSITVPFGAFASGASTCVVMIKGTGIAPVTMEYQLVAFDPELGTNLGLSALPTASPATAGGLLTVGTGNGQINSTSGVVPANTTQLAGQTVTASAGVTFPSSVSSLTAANVWSEPINAYNTSGQAGNYVNKLVSFPSNFSSLAITAGGIVSANATQLGGQAVTAASGVTFPSSVASPTNITAATGVQLAAVTHTGAVIPTVSTVTNRVTANTDQWNGVAVTGMPMPTYTQPTGFLTATFPTTVASTSNITTVGAVAGSVNSVTSAVTVGTINNGGKTDVENAVWDAVMTSHTGSTTFGGKVLRSGSTNAYIKVTGIGAGHVGADIHDIQPAVITNAAFAAGAINDNALDTTAVSEIADGVWDETLSGHLASGSTGAALNAAGAAGNPWSSDISTGYTGNQAGAILYNNLNATVGSRMATFTLPTNFSSLAITSDGKVNAGTVGDKTGYSLSASQTFSTTGSVASVTGAVQSVTNAVTVGTNNDKSGYSLSSPQTFNLTGNITGNLSGSVGSVSGAVGSVTGSVGSVAGNVNGSVGSVVGNVGGNIVGDVEGNVLGSVASVDSTVAVGSINENAINAAALDATAVTEIVTGVWNELRGASRPANSFGSYLDGSVAGVQTTVNTVNTNVNNLQTSVNGIVSDVNALEVEIATIKTNTDGIEPVTNKLNTTMQQIGSTGNYQFTVGALALAPTGGGGGGGQYTPVTLPLGTNVRQTLTFNQGASLPLREDILQQQDRTPLNLSGILALTYVLEEVDASTPKVYASATVVDAVGGRVRYTWQAGDLDSVGTYRERWIVTFSTGEVTVFGPLIKVV